MSNPVQIAYREYLAADVKWSKDLRAVFGRHAGDVRYLKLGETHPDCSESYQAFKVAGEKWRRLVREQRESNPKFDGSYVHAKA